MQNIKLPLPIIHLNQVMPKNKDDFKIEMIIGAIAPVMSEESSKKNMGSGQLWIGDIILLPSKRFYLPESYAGWQAEDLLRADMDVNKMEEIK